MTLYDARRSQQPPPEETKAFAPRENPQQAYAKRLCNAFDREKALRATRVCNEDIACTQRAEVSDSWMQIARKLRRADVDPERFMHVMFLDCLWLDNTLAHGPFANAWTFDFSEHLEKYRQYCVHADKYLEEQWRANALQFEVAVAERRLMYPQEAPKDCWQVILVDTRHHFSPLFKYCIAAFEGIDDVNKAERESAFLQMLTDPQGYLRVWKTRIPDDLRLQVESML